MSIRRAVFKCWPILLFALVGLIAVVMWWWVSYHSALGRIRALGAPVTYEDLVADSISDEENVAAGLRDAGNQLEPHAEAVSQALDALDEDPPAFDKTRETLAQTAGTIDTITQALDRPAYASLLTADKMADFDARLQEAVRVRSLARLLWLDCRLALADGRTDDAVTAAANLARFGKLLEGEPSLTNRMIACAIQTMAIDAVQRVTAEGSLDDASRDRLDAALAPLEDRSGLAEALRSERVVVLEDLAEMPLLTLPVRMWEHPPLLRYFEHAINDAEAGKIKAPQQGAGVLAMLSAGSIEAAWEAEQRVAAQAREARDALSSSTDGQ